MKSKVRKRRPIKSLSFLLLIVLTLTSSIFALNPPSHYRAGNNYLKKGMFSLAIDEYQKAIKLNPYYKEAYHGLGKAYYAQGLYREAEASLNKAITLDANYWPAYNDLALVYERQGLLDKAKEEYEKALKISPQTPELHFNLARVLAKKGKISKAIAQYQRVLRIDPRYIWAYINLGTLYTQMGDLDRAATYYRKALEYDPKNTPARINLGDLYRKRGWYGQAVNEYKGVLHILPDDPQALARLSEFYLARGEWDKAIKVNKKIVATSPETKIAHYSLGRAYEKKGNFTRAKKEYKETLKIDPYDEVARYYLENLLLRVEDSTSVDRAVYAHDRFIKGEEYSLKNKLPLAVYAYQRSIALSPQNPSFRWKLAELFSRQKHINQAITELIKARELDPENKDILFRLEQMYRALEKSISKKEEINLASVPPSGVRVLLLKFYPERIIHPGISEQMDDILSSILKQFPQVSVITERYQKKNPSSINIKRIDKIDDLFRMGERVKAQYLLWSEVSEELDRLEIKARLIEMATLKEKRINLSSSANDRIESLLLDLAYSVLEEIPLEGMVVKVKPQRVVVNLGTRHGLKIGSKLNVFRKGRVERDLQTGEIIGEKERMIGQLQVVSMEDNLSYAQILTYGLAEKIKKYDLVRLVREEK